MRIIKFLVFILILTPGCSSAQNQLEVYSDSLDTWQLKHPDYTKTCTLFHRLASKENDSEYLGRSYLYFASFQLYLADYDSARYYLREGLKHKTTYEGRLLLATGLSYCWEESYVLGFDYLQQAVPFLKDQPLRLSKAYNNMAICLKVQKDYKGSRAYYRLARKIVHKLNNTSDEANITLNLALSYNSEKQYDSTKRYLDEALIKAKESQNILSQTGVYSAFAGYCNHIGLYKKSLLYIDSAKYFCTQMRNRSYRMTGILIHESKAYLEMKDYRNFERTLDEMEKLLPGTGSEELRSHYFMNRYLLAEHKGNFEEALKMYMKSIKIRDSLYSDQKLVEISNMQHSVELSEKEREKEALKFRTNNLEKEQTINEVELTSKTNNLILAVIGLVLLIIVLVLMYNLYRKNKVQMALAEKSEKLAKEKVAQKELLIGEIHHRIKNNLQMISSMLFIEGNQSENAEVRKSLEMASQRLHSIGQLHQSLYSKNSYTGVEMGEYISSIAKSIESSNSKIEVDHQIEIESIVIGTDSAITLGLILNELITNAYKYAFKESDKNMLKIKGKIRQGILQIQLADSSEKAIDDNISSFGLKLVRALVKQMKGTIRFQYSDGNLIEIEIHKLKLINEH